MGEGFIVRRGGVGSEQALAPTITEVSTTDSSITFTLTNNDASTAVILYEVGDTTPDANSIELAAAATSSNLTISGLSPGTVTLYATANVTGKVKSNVTEKEFTLVNPFTAATGGTTAEYDSGGKRFRSHTFTSNGTFTVTNVGTTANDRNKVDYLIIAGGGGGAGRFVAGGGGAGGYRTTNGTSGANSSAESKVTVTAQSYSITVGGGGAAGTSDNRGGQGVNSTAFGITSIGGGGGGGYLNGSLSTGGDGGSGGGGGPKFAPVGAGGSGTSGQGFDGGDADISDGFCGGGGGGAGQVGQTTPTDGGNGGNGLANLLRTGSNETRGGGGGAGPDGIGGSGGGGDRGIAGAANTGGGGGGADQNDQKAGGSGLVVIRYEIAPSV